jgi:serine/threonine-protein kinase
MIDALIGEGGWRVPIARQEHLDRNVAIKVLPPYYASDQAFVDRFGRSQSYGAAFAPNIVTIHDAGTDKGRLYIILEYIGGGNPSSAWPKVHVERGNQNHSRDRQRAHLRA